MNRALAVMLCACACGLPGGDVLTKTPPKPIITTCEDAVAGVEGDACNFEGCTPPPGSCCRLTPICAGGTLKLIEDCSSCPPCTDEAQCAAESWCIDGHCVPCTKAEKCAECPAGLVLLDRNGCATCECGPPSGCATCSGGVKCSPSAYCALSCLGPSCCVGQCTPGGCAASPEGCTIDCGAVSCAGPCYAAGCSCTGTGGWTCTPACSPGAEAFTSRCKL